MDTRAAIQRYWDADAATYDRSASHYPSTILARAAWARALERVLPPPPARIADLGAGTGFLTLTAARLGHQVTAVDLSHHMLALLRGKAEAENLPVETLEAPADEPLAGNFDVIIERHVVWTLADPAAALARWRAAAPGGTLVLVESAWGRAASAAEAVKARGRKAAHRLRGHPPAHHDHYPAEVLAALPFGGGVAPRELLELVEAAGSPRAAARR